MNEPDFTPTRVLRPPLRLGLVQFRPEKARVERNLTRIRELVERHGRAHDLLVFPESAPSGYFLEGGVAEAARSAAEIAEALGPSAVIGSGAEAGAAGDGAQDGGAAEGPGPDLVLGFYERWRRRLYNSVGYFTPDGAGGYRALHVHRKLFLPTYGVFEEGRFVEPGHSVRPVDTRFGRLGMLVCEEAWHSLPATVLALGGAELLLVVSASPARDFTDDGQGLPGNLARWDRLARTMAEEHGVYVAVAQLVGSEGGKMFPGGSLIAGPDGTVVGRGPLLEEAVVSAALDGRWLDRARADSPLLADLEQMLPHLETALEGVRTTGEAVAGARAGDGVPADPSLRGSAEGQVPSVPLSPEPHLAPLDLPLVERALVQFIRDEVVTRRGFEKVVVGVSGGVDSAVSLLLACRALGPENVVALRLPYATSSPESLEHAALVIEETGAQGRTLDITPMVDAYIETCEPDAGAARRGNLMARMRAVTLFDQSAKLGALPLGTGNKSERLLGYFTWHADDSPPINPLGDLFKTHVWALARHLGVPDVIVEKPATADLVVGVDDEDELGISYHLADPILNWLVRGWAPAELVRAGFDEEDVTLVAHRLESTHWKRELPTVALLSSSAIGAFYLRPVDY